MKNVYCVCFIFFRNQPIANIYDSFYNIDKRLLLTEMTKLCRIDNISIKHLDTIAYTYKRFHLIFLRRIQNLTHILN